MSHNRKGDGWEQIENFPSYYAPIPSVKKILELQDAYRDKEVAELKAQIDEVIKERDTYRQWAKEYSDEKDKWQERCEAAERHIGLMGTK